MPEIYAVLLDAHFGAFDRSYCSVYYGSLAECEQRCGTVFGATLLPWPRSEWRAVSRQDCTMEHPSGAPAPGRICRMERL